MKSFQSWQQQQQPLPAPDTAVAVYSQISEPERECAPSGPGAVSGGSSTQINSAGIIFSSRPEGERKLAVETSITSVHSDSALADCVTETAVEIAVPSSSGTGGDVVKAASGYMMATRSVKEDLVGEMAVVELPTPKELIEIRQRKKVWGGRVCCVCFQSVCEGSVTGMLVLHHLLVMLL